VSRRYFTDEQTAEIARMREQGATLREIIDKHGGTTTSVGNALQRAGLSKGRIPTPDLTPDQERAIIARYQAGESVQALAHSLSRRSSVISDLLAREAITVRYGGKHHRFTEQESRDLAARYEAGASLAKLANEVGAKVSTVRNTLLRRGVTTRQSARPVVWTDDRSDLVVSSYEAGLSQADIAAKLGVSQAVISVALRRLGIKTRGPRTTGEGHRSWKGGRIVNDQGYVLVKPAESDLMYCTLNSSGYAVEHRLVAGRALGRKLRRSETVHHINGDKTDNRIENLQIRQGNHGTGVAFQCRACGSHDIVAVPLAD
jgi:transposase-like protein